MEEFEAAGQRFQVIRKGLAVKRCHTEAIIGEQTVGAHTAGVIALLFEFYDRKLPSVRLIHAALYHDVPEGVTGDVPAPMKWPEPTRTTSVDNLVLNYVRAEPLILLQDEKALLWLADKMDLMFYSLDQMQMGNSNMARVFIKLADRIEEKAAMEVAPESAQNLWLYLLDTFADTVKHMHVEIDMRSEIWRKL
jgi:5'-deoxynucleotidase YfbR-like HD superfamily hydrolase